MKAEKVTHPYKIILSKCINKFVIRNIGSQKAVGQYTQSVKNKTKNNSIKNPVSGKTVFQRYYKERMRAFRDKQKPSNFVTIRHVLENL